MCHQSASIRLWTTQATSANSLAEIVLLYSLCYNFIDNFFFLSSSYMILLGQKFIVKFLMMFFPWTVKPPLMNKNVIKGTCVYLLRNLNMDGHCSVRSNKFRNIHDVHALNKEDSGQCILKQLLRVLLSSSV